MKVKEAATARYENVLLIDEDEIDNYINERIIQTSNFAKRVIVKNSGNSALEHLRNVLKNNEELPQIIFLDLNMPIMDGFEFLEEYDKLVQDHPNLRSDVKIIVLSSSISPTDIDRASANTYVFKYLNKPLSQKYLDAIYI